MSGNVTAHFIGGPEHGAIKVQAQAAKEVRVALMRRPKVLPIEAAEDPRFEIELAYGTYVQCGYFYDPEGWDGRGHHFIYRYAGENK